MVLSFANAVQTHAMKKRWKISRWKRDEKHKKHWFRSKHPLKTVLQTNPRRRWKIRWKEMKNLNGNVWVHFVYESRICISKDSFLHKLWLELATKDNVWVRFVYELWTSLRISAQPNPHAQWMCLSVPLLRPSSSLPRPSTPPSSPTPAATGSKYNLEAARLQPQARTSTARTTVNI